MRSSIHSIFTRVSRREGGAKTKTAKKRGARFQTIIFPSTSIVETEIERCKRATEVERWAQKSSRAACRLCKLEASKFLCRNSLHFQLKPFDVVQFEEPACRQVCALRLLQPAADNPRFV